MRSIRGANSVCGWFWVGGGGGGGQSTVVLTGVFPTCYFANVLIEVIIFFFFYNVIKVPYPVSKNPFTL